MSAATLAAIFAAGCTSSSKPAGTTGDSSSTVTATAETTTTTTITTEPTSTSIATTTSAGVTSTRGTTTRPPTTTRARQQATTTISPTTTSNYSSCTTDAYGYRTCAVPGRPLWSRWGARRRQPLVPTDELCGESDLAARLEYASVASFSDLALRLLAVGAPADLVRRCHRAALDELDHAAAEDRIEGRTRVDFGPIDGLRGRRIGGGRTWGRARSLSKMISTLAVESFVDGWVNESRAAADLRARAANADERAAVVLFQMARDEDGHAVLARDIVTWCMDARPMAVGRALALAVPVAA